MSIDLSQLVRALREDPQQRAALRQELLGDQDDIQAVLVRLATAQARTDERLATLTERIEALTQRVDDLAAAQQRTEEAVKGLLDVVSGIHDRVGKLDGESLERKYREKGHAYFQGIARRLRPVGGATLSALVDDGREDGHLTETEATSLLYADVVFSGLRRDRTPVYLVAEVSVTIARHDVRRARERADLLARLVDTPVIAIVAGEFAPEPVALAAQDADVWRVTNGRAVSPEDDFED